MHEAKRAWETLRKELSKEKGGRWNCIEFGNTGDEFFLPKQKEYPTIAFDALDHDIYSLSDTHSGSS